LERRLDLLLGAVEPRAKIAPAVRRRRFDGRLEGDQLARLAEIARLDVFEGRRVARRGEVGERPLDDSAQVLHRSVRDAGFDLGRDLVERRLIHHGEIREHLAVDLDVGALQACHEHAVAHAQLAHRRVDARDPQRAELALLHAAVAVRILPRLHQRLLRDAVDVLAPAAESLGLPEDLLVARARRYTPLDSWHGALLTRVRQDRQDLPLVRLVDLGAAAQMALTLGALLGEDVAHVGLRALDPAARAHAETLRGAALGFHLRHDEPTPSLF